STPPCCIRASARTTSSTCWMRRTGPSRAHRSRAVTCWPRGRGAARCGRRARGDVVASWAGLRPLLREEGKAPSEISRKDEIATDPATGMISIAGGKLTTYRRMAERVVDLVFTRLGRKAPPCRTDQVPLPGGEPTTLDAGAVARRLPQLSALEAGRLFRLHGASCERILARVAEDSAAGEVVAGLPGVLRAEIEHALDEEMALTLEDLLDRRTRSLSFDRRQGLGGV